MHTPKLTADETAQRGDALYAQQIRPQIEAGNAGKIVAIDVLTGAYALGDSALAASRQLRTQSPNAEVWFVRVGNRALHRIGAYMARCGV